MDTNTLEVVEILPGRPFEHVEDMFFGEGDHMRKSGNPCAVALEIRRLQHPRVDKGIELREVVYI